MSITLEIDTVDRSLLINWRTIQKKDMLNNRVDTLQFEIKKYGTRTFVPALGSEVVLKDSGVAIFGGVVVKIDDELDSTKIIRYKVQCKDYSQFLDRQLVTERYQNKTVAFIVNDLVTNNATGFTSTNATSTLVINSISFNRIPISQCLQKLARLISYSWYIDDTKDVHFFEKNTEIAPFNLTDTSNNYIYDSLRFSDDLSQLRNKIIVEGGLQEGNARTETFDGDGVKDTFPLKNKFAYAPDVTVGGVAQTVGIDFLDADASFDCMWSYNEKYLRFTAGNVPATGADNIEATGIPLYPIVVNVPSAASISEFGVYEYSIVDKTIRTQNEAFERAIAEVTAYGDSLVEGSFRTYNAGLRSGMIININSATRARNEDVLIQSVDVRLKDPNGTQLVYDIKFATLRTLGIIEYLLSRLESKELTEDEVETLLNLYQFTDTITFSDSVATPTTSIGPYNWSPTVTGAFNWNFGVWG